MMPWYRGSAMWPISILRDPCIAVRERTTPGGKLARGIGSRS